MTWVDKRRQFPLFDFAPHCSCGLSAQNPNADEWLLDRLSAGNSHDVISRAALFCCLDESKFTRLFWEDDFDDFPDRVTLPLDIPDVGGQLRTIQESAAGFAACFLEQLAYLPVDLWSPEFVSRFCEGTVLDALAGIRRRPLLADAMVGHVSEQFLRENVDPNPDPVHEDYLFLTNISSDFFHQPSCPLAFQTVVSKLIADLLDVPGERLPEIHLVTPESRVQAPGFQYQNRLLHDILTSPNSYYIIARQGKVSVIPNVFEGEYSMWNDRREVVRIRIDVPLTHQLSSHNELLRHIVDFEALLNSKATKEQDIQNFLATHPEFLLGINEGYCDIRSQICLFDSRDERLIPDFAARVADSNLWELIELKLPTHPITVRNGDRDRLSAAAARGIAELLRAADYFGTNANRARAARKLGLAPYQPRLALVIGRNSTNSRLEWTSGRFDFPMHVRVFSYDHLLEYARRRASEFDMLCSALDVGGHSNTF